MISYNRQELQEDIFRMYGACIGSENRKSRKAPVDINKLK